MRQSEKKMSYRKNPRKIHLKTFRSETRIRISGYCTDSFNKYSWVVQWCACPQEHYILMCRGEKWEIRSLGYKTTCDVQEAHEGIEAWKWVCELGWLWGQHLLEMIPGLCITEFKRRIGLKSLGRHCGQSRECQRRYGGEKEFGGHRELQTLQKKTLS